MPLRVSIIDYNAGNLGSIFKAIKTLDAEPLITNKINEVLDADAIVLPGVGAFGDCIANLKKTGLIENKLFETIQKNKTPFLGICLGLQMLFEESEEMGLYQGLGIIPGRVIRFPKTVKCPQIGWNSVSQKINHPIFEGIPNNTYFYFVHSFYGVCKNSSNILAETNYENNIFTSMVIKGNIMASQFHPEKSGKWGLKLLQNFLNLAKK